MTHPESIQHVLDLRMNVLSLESFRGTLHYRNYLIDKVKTLMSQDSSYYRNSHSATGMNRSDREKMAQWEYRIVDHFNMPRDLVAIAFSFLDRFTAKCLCDRQAYKLAAMTSLLLAMKLHNPRRFSIGTLATLSRGEFKATHIAQMELIMLKTLDWRLSPPTSQSFIQIWGEYLLEGGYYVKETIDRAIFLAEIAVFDTLLASKERALIAIAALFAGGVGCDTRLKQAEANVLRKIRKEFGVSYTQEEISTIRNRLLYIYSKTLESLSEYRLQSRPMMPGWCSTRIEKSSPSVTPLENAVKMKYFQSPRTVRARYE